MRFQLSHFRLFSTFLVSSLCVSLVRGRSNLQDVRKKIRSRRSGSILPVNLGVSTTDDEMVSAARAIFTRGTSNEGTLVCRQHNSRWRACVQCFFLEVRISHSDCGAEFTVQIDTGSTDLWINPLGRNFTVLNDTYLYVEEAYGSGDVQGTIAFAKFSIGDFVVESQGRPFLCNAHNVSLIRTLTARRTTHGDSVGARHHSRWRRARYSLPRQRRMLRGCH